MFYFSHLKRYIAIKKLQGLLKRVKALTFTQFSNFIVENNFFNVHVHDQSVTYIQYQHKSRPK